MRREFRRQCPAPRTAHAAERAALASIEDPAFGSARARCAARDRFSGIMEPGGRPDASRPGRGSLLSLSRVEDEERLRSDRAGEIWWR